MQLRIWWAVSGQVQPGRESMMRHHTAVLSFYLLTV